MQSKGWNNRLSGVVFGSRISALLLSMFAAMASLYIAGRLWQDAENRVYVAKELDRITGQGQSAISVDDTLKIISCRCSFEEDGGAKGDHCTICHREKENHIEAPDELPKKTKLFFALAAEKWDAEFYAKVNDDVYVNIDPLGKTLAAHMDKPRVYIGCMKSGEVFSEQSQKWYEPDWWKFGDGKTYFRHASGEMFVISQALAKFVSINRSILRTYAHDDISTGSWFIGLDVKHIDERKFCCSSWSSGAICAGV